MANAEQEDAVLINDRAIEIIREVFDLFCNKQIQLRDSQDLRALSNEQMAWAVAIRTLVPMIRSGCDKHPELLAAIEQHAALLAASYLGSS